MDIQETIQFNLGATYNEGLEEGRRDLSRLLQINEKTQNRAHKSTFTN